MAPTASSVADSLGAATPDGARALAHVNKFATEIGPRVAGTDSERTARDYLRATLETYGYDVPIQEFAFDASAFLARIDIGTTALAAFALDGSAAGAVSGPLVQAGIGRREDFPAGGARGAIALIERGDLTFAQKAANAVDGGASAVVIYNNAAGRFAGKLDRTSIPVVAISKEDGDRVVGQLASGPVTARVEVSPPQGTAYNVIARPRDGARCTTVTGGHYDTVPVAPGADDNASGTASVLEVARVAAAMRLAGGNCFVLFSAEEFGLFGSKAFLERLAPADLTAIRAMINLDVVGLGGDVTLIGSDDLVATARLEAGKLGVTATPGSLPMNAGSDHLSFQEKGVPVVMLTRGDDSIHTAGDTADRIVARSLADDVAIALALLTAIGGR